MVSRLPRKPGKQAARPRGEVALATPREVALVIETSKAYGRGVLKGISTWLHQRKG